MIIHAWFSNGYAGCDQEECFFFEEGTAAGAIDATVYEWAYGEAESYSYVHFGWDGDYTDEEYEEYLECNCEWGWEDLSYDEYLNWCEDQGCDPREEWME